MLRLCDDLFLYRLGEVFLQVIVKAVEISPLFLRGTIALPLSSLALSSAASLGEMLAGVSLPPGQRRK